MSRSSQDLDDLIDQFRELVMQPQMYVLFFLSHFSCQCQLPLFLLIMHFELLDSVHKLRPPKLSWLRQYLKLLSSGPKADFIV
ncbi:hypothetical protein BYT27DRAFT_6543531 [Phlegmacium glaucopus]|nr:hypothetical protein BYT27DRAFT_6543531 [Phlegmacium glaucopus]